MTSTDWSDFYLVQDELRQWTEADVDAAEATLGVVLPDGFRSLVTTLGSGVISGQPWVFPPTEMQEAQRFYQRVVREAWFFEETDGELTQEQAMDSVLVADSDGDLIAFHRETRRLHVLPRDDEHTRDLGSDMSDVVAWFQDSGDLW